MGIMWKRVAGTLDGYHAKDGWGSASDWHHTVAKASFHCFYKGTEMGKTCLGGVCTVGTAVALGMRMAITCYLNTRSLVAAYLGSKVVLLRKYVSGDKL